MFAVGVTYGEILKITNPPDTEPPTKRIPQRKLFSQTTSVPLPLLFLLLLLPVLTILSTQHSPTHYETVTTGTRADWQLPDYCRRLRLYPEPFNKACHRNRTNMLCDYTSGEYAGKTLFFSSQAQDYYLYNYHFRYLHRPGVYAEVHTKDAIIGNTLFLDRCLGWKGVCVEPNTDLVSYIFRSRGCEIVPTCIASVDGQKKVVDKRVMLCMTMDVVMRRRGIRVLDYLSLDVGGDEIDVLKSFDWRGTKVNVITVSTSGGLVEIQEFLEGVGYRRHVPVYSEESKLSGLLGRDAVFLRKEVTWGRPV